MFGMNGNGMRRVDASGVSTGKTRSMNQASSQVAVARRSARRRCAQRDARPRASRRAQLPPDALLLVEQRLGARLDLGELLRRRAAVRRQRGDAAAFAWPISPATRTE